MKSVNMDNWVNDILNQIFVRNSHTEIILFKKK